MSFPLITAQGSFNIAQGSNSVAASSVGDHRTMMMNRFIANRYTENYKYPLKIHAFIGNFISFNLSILLDVLKHCLFKQLSKC